MQMSRLGKILEFTVNNRYTQEIKTAELQKNTADEKEYTKRATKEYDKCISASLTKTLPEP